MLNNNIQAFIGCTASYTESHNVIFGAPFDSTTSYRPGARFGSRAIRSESYGIETYSPYQDKDLEDARIFDSGDLELCIGDVQIALAQIEECASDILSGGKRPVMLGGEHLVTLGVLRAMAREYPDLHLIHFDAHADLRDDYLGARLSHATVMRRAWDIFGDGRIHQFGIRSGERNEFLFSDKHTEMHKFNFDGLANTVHALHGKPVYFTLDLDVLDPSVFPGTGTPEAGGVCFTALLKAIQTIATLNIIGLDLVELSPPYDQSGMSTIVACKLLRETLLALL